MKCNIIVAMCKHNHGIGFNNSLPWDIKEDLQHFSKLTKGNGKNVIIMGANTYKSLNMPGLQGRDNFILSSSLKLDFTLKKSNNENTNYIVKTFNNLDILLEICKANNYDTAWIIGGSTIYKEFLHRKLVNKCYVTLIHKLFDCDTFFPFNIINNWLIKTKSDLIHNNKYDFKIEFIEYILGKL
jgi:dihydrofolate reductase